MVFSIRIVIAIFLIVTLCVPNYANQLDEDRSKTEPNNNSQDRNETLKEHRSEAELEDLELPINVLNIFVPPEKDKPKHTESGGTRNERSCSISEDRIDSIMPEGNYGLTFQAKPTIYLYLERDLVEKAFLVLHDEIDNSYQKAIIPLSKISSSKNSLQPTIVNFPDTFTPLKIGNRYSWSITFICNLFPRPSDPTIRGWVKRVEYNREFVKELRGKNQKQKIEWYAKNGFWYDMLSIIPLNSNWWQFMRNR